MVGIAFLTDLNSNLSFRWTQPKNSTSASQPVQQLDMLGNHYSGGPWRQLTGCRRCIGCGKLMALVECRFRPLCCGVESMIADSLKQRVQKWCLCCGSLMISVISTSPVSALQTRSVLSPPLNTISSIVSANSDSMSC